MDSNTLKQHRAGIMQELGAVSQNIDNCAQSLDGLKRRRQELIGKLELLAEIQPAPQQEDNDHDHQ